MWRYYYYYASSDVMCSVLRVLSAVYLPISRSAYLSRFCAAGVMGVGSSHWISICSARGYLSLLSG